MDIDITEILAETERLANESDSERADRLHQLGSETDVDEWTLYETEEALRALAREARQSSDADLNALVSQAKGFAPMFLPADADVSHLDADALVQAFVQKLMEDPEGLAEGVLVFYSVFDQVGLYDEVDTSAHRTVERVLNDVDGGE